MSGYKLADRGHVLARVALCGPSGSGKTYSALLLAQGLAGSLDQVAVLDTERGRSTFYQELGPFKVATMARPFQARRFIEAIKLAADEGMKILIIDSLTHEWAGQGGIFSEYLDSVSKVKNPYTIWKALTPKHDAVIEAIMQADLHIIATMRTKDKYVLVEDRGRQVPKKVGTRLVQRPGTEYEFDIMFKLDSDHEAIADKDRTGIFDGMREKLSAKHGEKLRRWIEAGGAPNNGEGIALDTAPPATHYPETMTGLEKELREGGDAKS